MFSFSSSIRSKAVRKCTQELFYKTVNNPHVTLVCAQIRDAHAKMMRGEMSPAVFETFKKHRKEQLPVFIPHATFPKGRRRKDEAVPSSLAMYDKDHLLTPASPEVLPTALATAAPVLPTALATAAPVLPTALAITVKNSPAPLASLLASHALSLKPITEPETIAQLRALGVALVHVTPSTEGYRLFFRVPAGMDIPQAQQWMADQLHDPDYDACVKDLSRCSFAVPLRYILYKDDDLLFHTPSAPVSVPSSSAPAASGQPIALAATVEQSSSPAPAAASSIGEKHECTAPVLEYSAPVHEYSAPVPTVQSAAEPTYHGIPASKIIAKYWELNNNGNEPTQGDRDTLTFDLACSLRHIFGFDRSILDRIIPNYDGFPEQEKLKCIDSALAEPRRYMPAKIKRVIEAMEPATNKLPEATTDEEDQLPPEMPKELPPLVSLLVSRTPELYRPSVAHAIFPSLGIYPWHTSVRYIDGVEHEFTFMNVLMAGTGAGKDCITPVINHIMADARARDAENKVRLKEWKEEYTSMGANKEKPKRPEGLIIQEIHPDITNPAFVQRLADNDEHRLYCKMNEIEQFNNLRGSGGSPQQFQIMCLSFDPGNLYGQTRASAQSVEETVCIRFNWNASTTINKGKRYFKKVLTDGPISRINFCTIPERPIGAEMPIYGTYDDLFDKQLRMYIENLKSASGVVDCPEAFALAKQLDQENKEYAIKTQSRVFENLSFRANVIAYLKACLLYIAQGYQWTKVDEDFIRWSLRYDLWCKMHFFGQDIAEAERCDDSEKRRGPRNLLEMLHASFTIHDAQVVRSQQGMPSDEHSTRKMINTWVARKYISRQELAEAASQAEELFVKC